MQRKTTACLALGEIGRSGCLPLPPGLVNDIERDSNVEQDDDVPTETNAKKMKEESPTEATEETKTVCKHDEITKLSLINTLIALIKTSNENNKVKHILVFMKLYCYT